MHFFNKSLALGIVLLSCVVSTSQAGVIMVSGDTNIGTNGQFLYNVFADQDVLSLNTGNSAWNTENFTPTVEGYTSSFLAINDLTSNIESNIDWLISSTDTLYTNSQMDFISEFMNGGGNLFIAGEGQPLYPEQGDTANQLLDYLGSSISVSDSIFSGGTSLVLISNLFTSDVSSFNNNYSAALTGGTALFGVDHDHYNVAFENYATSVPEPNSIALMMLGLAGLGFSRKKKTS